MFLLVHILTFILFEAAFGFLLGEYLLIKIRTVLAHSCKHSVRAILQTNWTLYILQLQTHYCCHLLLEL
jgi:hypothetical protein